VELLISADSQENGRLNSVRWSVDEAVTFGRGPESLLQLDGNGISREHFKLHFASGAVFITDLSSNGTWLNAHRLTRHEPQRVTSADEIRIPGFTLRIDGWDESASGDARSQPTAVASSGPTAESSLAAGPFAFLHKFGGALSRVEKLLLALALATLIVVGLYLVSC
jgi:predicted component of type VI protein secretion system